MANNIDAGLNFVTAKVTNTWFNVGITTANTVEVYTTVEGNPVSYRPNKTINTLTATGVVEGQGYQLTSKIDRDMTNVFGPVGAFEPAVFNSMFNT